MSGNVEAARSVDIGVDLSAPGVQLTCNGAACSSSWYTSGVLVALAGIANGPAPLRDLRVTLDGTPSRNGSLYTGPFTLQSPALLRATAFNMAGTASSELSQQLQVDPVAPAISITAPLNGASVTGTQAIVTAPTDNIAVTRVRFYLDAKQLGTRTTAPWKWNWDTAAATKGSHVLSARAEDAAGNATSSASISVVVR